MSITNDEIAELRKTAKELRMTMMDIVLWSGGAHIGGSFSSAEILTILYFKYLNIRPEEPKWPDRDRFVLSKGHAATGYIPTLQKRGFFPYDELKTFNHFGSPFAMHPDSNKVIGCDASAGSLGHGLAMAAGMGWAARYMKKGWKTVCLMGDGECSEGSVWEASMTINHQKLSNVITIVDRNHLMIDGNTEDVVGLEPFADKWRAFGYDVHEVNGHDYRQLAAALDAGWAAADETGQPKAKPVLILADTVKGKGVDFMENNVKWHYGSADSDLVAQAKAQIEANYQKECAADTGKEA
jgi:transketolase